VHGGAWKIAYADFVTAMMAFFLLMWLLGSTAKGELQGIADYFNSPLKVAMSGGTGAGNSSSIIPGGGNDLSKVMARCGAPTPRKSTRRLSAEEMRAEQRPARRPAHQVAARRWTRSLRETPGLNEFRSQIHIDVTPDGLQIQIVDDQNRPMFDSGSALVKPYMRDILREIGAGLGGVKTASVWPAIPTRRPMAMATAATATGSCLRTVPTHRAANWWPPACPTPSSPGWWAWAPVTCSTRSIRARQPTGASASRCLPAKPKSGCWEQTLPSLRHNRIHKRRKKPFLPARQPWQ
jgi:hypothetical protein